MTPALPTPGTTWTPTRPGSRAKPRTVAWAGGAPATIGFLSGYTTVGFRHAAEATAADWPITGHDNWISDQGWRAWVRKHAAVAVTP